MLKYKIMKEERFEEKGMTSYSPEKYRVKKHIIEIWEKIMEKYGFEKYETPIISPLSLYEQKNKSRNIRKSNV